ncbi:amino acid permease [Sphingobacterium rhinopitheci]|uniref:amino acid permease n=1 Tax=Sphingobacterium rhinopitheci TaxID=2781960 RepID=UPI001F51E549|nr:amino acid permease [Sphingobacterium rhinopitheci]
MGQPDNSSSTTRTAETSKPLTGPGSMSKFAFFAMTASLFLTVYEYPTFAQSGQTLIFYLILCGALWFLPVALCAAELATVKGYSDGGIFSWVGKPLGTSMGFAALFFQWFQITVGFVTMFYFIIGVFASVLDIPQLNEVPWIKFSVVLVLFWITTLLQFRGTSFTAKIAKYAFSLGIVLPVLALAVLAIYYFSNGHTVSTNFTGVDFFPKEGNLAAMTAFVLTYMGVEASAPKAVGLNNFKRSYPLIMMGLVLVGVILCTLGGSIVAMVIEGNISSNEGLIDAFRVLISPGKNSWPVIVIGVLICFGIFGQVSSWVVGPTSGLQYVAEQGYLPARFAKKNSKGVPTFILLIQGIIVTIWAAVLTFGSGSSGANMSFQTAISLTVVIYLSAYVLFFVAYFVVVFRHKDAPRDYAVPGGLIGKVFFGGAGLIMSLLALYAAFSIPSSMSASEGRSYIVILICSFIATIVFPFILYKIFNKGRES